MVSNRKYFKRYYQSHKDKLKIGSYRRTTRMFLNKFANHDDLSNAKELIDNKLRGVNDD